jgi:hypothetical protein
MISDVPVTPRDGGSNLLREAGHLERDAIGIESLVRKRARK